MDQRFWDQLARVDRLLKIVGSTDQLSKLGSALNFEDALTFACQSMWHLKDWILNDPEFRPKDIAKLKADIHERRCLLICADLANGSKHLTLTRPKIGASLADQRGICFYPSEGLFQTYYYVACDDPTDRYHGIEIRDLLIEARSAWEEIIDAHYLTAVDI